MPPRLTGRALGAVRALGETPAIRLLRGQALRDYGVDRLLAMGPEARAWLETSPHPVQGRPPRRWHDAGLGAPTPTRVTLATLRDAYAHGRTTPRAVLDRLLDHVGAARFGHATHSPFILLDAPTARAAADASTARWAAGAPLGDLDGMPIPVKDEADMRGLPTRGGTKYRTTPATTDAWLVDVLRRAGAVLPGKTHSTEWGMNPAGQNPHYAMPRNVWDRGRAAGGSSTGSAVAVALGLAPAAIGSDGGGSIRIPSSLEGVYGLKPTYVRIGRSGDIFGASSVAHVGPIGASAGDLATLLAPFLVDVDPADPMHRWPEGHASRPADLHAAIGRGVRGCRIGVVEADWADCDPALAAAARRALEALRADGAEIVPVELPLASAAAAIGMLVIGPETAGNLLDDLVEHGAQMGDDLRLLLALLRTMSAEEVALAGRSRTLLRQQAARALAGVDVLAMPTVAAPAPAYPLHEDGIAVSDPGGLRALTRYAFFGNLTGLPAGSVPVGLVDGLPAGLQVVGDAWDEASVLAVMAHVERTGVGRLPRPEGHLDLAAGLVD